MEGKSLKWVYIDIEPGQSESFHWGFPSSGNPKQKSVNKKLLDKQHIFNGKKEKKKTHFPETPTMDSVEECIE